MVLETQLGKLFAKSGVKSPRARARDIYMLTEGAIAMLLIHGDRDYARAAGSAAKRLLRPALKK